MRRKKKGLLLKFAVIFLIFTIITLTICGVSTYVNQNDIYRRQCRSNLAQLADYLCRLMQEDGREFVAFQEYFLAHTDTLRIPADVSDWESEEANFMQLFHQTYPGRTLEVDMDYSELSDELMEVCTVYNYEYWMNLFMDAMEDFDVEYIYYITPIGDDYTITYSLDIAPYEFEENGVTYRILGDLYPEPVEKHPMMWEAWESGKPSSGFDTFDNEFGHTYAYYAPLIIDGQKLGMVGAEVTVANVNHEILINTIRQLLVISITLLLSMGILLMVINRNYIRKIEHLSDNVKRYAENKDVEISGVIEHEAVGNDEICALANQTAAMILELDNYMKSIVETTRELTETKEHAQKMNELAIRDALTGIRNKTAYDSEIKKLEWRMMDGFKEFGIAMVDLNYLKRINDTYGHEQGNAAIKNICHMVCVIFEHSPVFRIGGDEFVIILTGHDYEHIKELVDKFNGKLEELAKREDLAPWEAVSASIGYALYDSDRDSSIDNVFKRADKAMYERKKEMKAARE